MGAAVAVRASVTFVLGNVPLHRQESAGGPWAGFLGERCQHGMKGALETLDAVAIAPLPMGKEGSASG